MWESEFLRRGANRFTDFDCKTPNIICATLPFRRGFTFGTYINALTSSLRISASLDLKIHNLCVMRVCETQIHPKLVFVLMCKTHHTILHTPTSRIYPKSFLRAAACDPIVGLFTPKLPKCANGRYN